MLKLSRALLFVLVTVGASLHSAPPEKETTTKRDLISLGKASPAQIQAFFDSAPYKNLHQSDEEFIKDLYHGVLQREPDAQGYKIWIAVLHQGANEPKARQKAVEAFLKSPEYLEQHSSPPPVAIKKNDTSRNPGNVLFNQTGVFINSASALPPDRYVPLFKKGRVAWITLQIDNGGQVRADNVASIESGWMDAWRKAGFKVGFWGAARGATQHDNAAALAESTSHVQVDAALAVTLTAKYKGDFYIADCEDGYQGYNPKDPAPALNRVYVEAFQKAATAAGIGNLPRALSSMGRVALDMQPWIEGGWDAMPQAYWNAYAVYQPSKCVDFYVHDTGWPIERVHPTIGTFTSEGEKRTVSLPEYQADLKTRGTIGCSFYLPESYLRFNESLYEQLANMAAQ